MIHLAEIQRCWCSVQINFYSITSDIQYVLQLVQSVSLPHCRTSARLLETKAANASSQYNTVAGKKPTAARNPAVVLALDRVNSDGTIYSTGQVPSVPNGAQYAMSATGGGKPSLYGGTQGWDTVRRIFNPHRGEA